MTTPTAISTTLPFEINALKSLKKVLFLCFAITFCLSFLHTPEQLAPAFFADSTVPADFCQQLSSFFFQKIRHLFYKKHEFLFFYNLFLFLFSVLLNYFTIFSSQIELYFTLRHIFLQNIKNEHTSCFLSKSFRPEIICLQKAPHMV